MGNRTELTFPLTFEGKVYHTLKQLARNRVPYNLFIQRLRRGYTLEESIYGKESYPVGKLVFSLLADACEYFGKEYSRVYSRTRYGHTLDTAMFGIKEKEFNGYTYTSEKQLAEHYNMSYSYFRKKKKEGFSLEEILLRKK